MASPVAGFGSVLRRAAWRRLGIGSALALSMLGQVTVARGGVSYEPHPFLYIQLATMEPVRTWYSVVPSDAKVLVPLAAWSEGNVQYPYSVPLSFTEGRVEPDADIRDSYSFYGAVEVSPELTLVPGHTYTASLEGPNNLAPDIYVDSTFSFTIHGGPAGELLNGIELDLSKPSAVAEDVNPTCCEVEPAECGGEGRCYQCWQRVSYSTVEASWKGPAVPYIDLQTEAVTDTLTSYAAGLFQDFYKLEATGEYCVEGTAALGEESRTVSRCTTASELPALPEEEWADDWELAEARSCLGEPAVEPGVTYLYVKRRAKEEDAMQALHEVSQPDYHEPMGTCAFGGSERRQDGTHWRLLAGALGLGYFRRRRRCQLTERGRWCGRRWMRGKAELRHQPQCSALRLGNLGPAHGTAASRTFLQICSEEVCQQPGPAMTAGFGCTVVCFPQQLVRGHRGRDPA